MNIERLIERMAAFPGALGAAVSGVTEEEARHKPAHPSYPGGAWSIVEIVNHLADEEVEDFRARVELTLADPGAPWPKIDPEGAAAARRYNERDLGESLARFAAERSASIQWLRSLRDPDWLATHEHPLGALRAGDLMVSWSAHDALHLRQVGKRLYDLACRDAPGFSAGYAGPLSA